MRAARYVGGVSTQGNLVSWRASSNLHDLGGWSDDVRLRSGSTDACLLSNGITKRQFKRVEKLNANCPDCTRTTIGAWILMDQQTMKCPVHD